MASIAYEDSARTKIIYADSCTIKDRNTRYYCENPDCPAHLYLRAFNSVLTAHFCATKDHPHVGWCHKRRPDFKPTDYSESDFNYDNAIDAILSPSKKSGKTSTTLEQNTGDGKKRGLSKTAQIYTMCKHYRPENSYNSIKIWQMLFDVRCNYLLTKGLFGKHLIECTFFRYDNSGQLIYFDYPLNKSLPNQYRLRIHISETDLYYKLRKKIYNKDNLPIVIVGDWGKYAADAFECEVKSGKQIYLPDDQAMVEHLDYSLP